MIHHPLLRQLVAQIDREMVERPVETDRALRQLAIDVRQRSLLAAWYVGNIASELCEHLLDAPDDLDPDATSAIEAWFYAEGQAGTVEAWLAEKASEAAQIWGDHEFVPRRTIERALLGGFTVSEIEERFGLGVQQGVSRWASALAAAEKKLRPTPHTPRATPRGAVRQLAHRAIDAAVAMSDINDPTGNPESRRLRLSDAVIGCLVLAYEAARRCYEQGLDKRIAEYALRRASGGER